jgi:hypothetical protein
MSYADDLRIFMNIMAQSPEGLSDPNLIAKFSKAKFQLNQMASMDQINAQNMPLQTPVGTPQTTQTPPMGNNANQEPLGATGLNQANPMDNGQGSMNLPQ